jgi:hypothetical protein
MIPLVDAYNTAELKECNLLLLEIYSRRLQDF